VPTRAFPDSRIYGAPRTVAPALEKYETAGGLPGRVAREGCKGEEEERSVEGERTGWKATGKAFFHMLIQQAGCAHEYLWSKRAFLSSLCPSPSPALSLRRYFALSLSLSLSLSRCIHVVPKLSRFLSTADARRKIGRTRGRLGVEMSSICTNGETRSRVNGTNGVGYIKREFFQDIRVLKTHASFDVKRASSREGSSRGIGLARPAAAGSISSMLRRAGPRSFST